MKLRFHQDNYFKYQVDLLKIILNIFTILLKNCYYVGGSLKKNAPMVNNFTCANNLSTVSQSHLQSCMNLKWSQMRAGRTITFLAETPTLLISIQVNSVCLILLSS